jgi:uncharacterized protein YkwD
MNKNLFKHIIFKRICWSLTALSLLFFPLIAEAGDFNTDILAQHNKLRQVHQATALKWNSTIAAVAQEWATKLAKENKMYHRSPNSYGENIYMTSGKDVGGVDPVQAWYDEIKVYNYKAPGFSSATGHFTQVVWVGSTELGCGKATSTGGTYVVCNYNPPGNFTNAGQFQANVLTAGTAGNAGQTPSSGQPELTREQLAEQIKGLTFTMGNGLTFTVKDPLNKIGVWQKQYPYTLTYGSFVKLGPDQVGYKCPGLGNVTFTIKKSSIDWEVNETGRNFVQTNLGAKPNERGSLAR